MSKESNNEMPLSKSLGFSIRENYGNNLKGRIGHEYLELYNEMVKASQESAVIDDDEDDFEIGTDLTRLKHIRDSRRSVRTSSVGRRRARSQALRREKLNSQSLRSHRAHSRHSSLEHRLLI